MEGDASSDTESSDGQRRQVTMPSSKKASFAMNSVNAKALEVIKINSRSKLFALMSTLKYKLRMSMTKYPHEYEQRRLERSNQVNVSPRVNAKISQFMMVQSFFAIPKFPH